MESTEMKGDIYFIDVLISDPGKLDTDKNKG